MHSFDLPRVPLHKLPKMPSKIEKFENLIVYGPQGSGKYTQALRLVAPYSKSGLKYHKRVNVLFNGEDYPIKISDVHYEVDMELLGCTPRVLWHELYTHIKNIIYSKYKEKHGIIVCTNFHATNKDILDVFHSYMQEDVRYILITDAVSFIPKAVTARCRIVALPRPSESAMQACFGTKGPEKNLRFIGYVVDNTTPVCQKLKAILDGEESFAKLRDELYNILVLNLNVETVVWSLLTHTFSKISEAQQRDVLKSTFVFFQYYNNNYRPIYHLEYYMYMLMRAIQAR
jgi:hypothetical protein